MTVIQRPLRGSRISTFYPTKSLPSLSSLDSAFQLQEYISLLIRLDVHDVDSIVSLPGTSKKDGEVVREKDSAEVGKEEDKDSDRKSDIQVDRACWIYEQLREIFEQAEAESSLYARFLALTSKFDLLPAEFLLIPSSQYSGEEERDGRDGQGQYPPHQQHLEPPVPRASLSPEIQQHQLGVCRPRSPFISASSDPSIAIGGIGEHPTTGNGARSRFGRNRTDTMVFADIEFSRVAEEMAAKARAGEFDADCEIEAPKSARLVTET